MSTALRHWLHPAHAGALALVSALLGLYASLAVNAPTGDDYLAILQFANDWTEARTVTEHFTVFADPHFSHRLYLLNVAIILQLALGPLNFVALMAVGWACWLASCLALLREFPISHSGAWIALPAGLILAVPQGFTNHLNAMQAVSNLGVIAGALWALRLLLGGGTRAQFGSGLALAITTGFVSASGLLVAPLAAILLLWQRRAKRAIAAAVVCGLTWTLFFLGHESSALAIDASTFLPMLATATGGAFALFSSPAITALVAGTILLGLAIAVGFRALFEPRAAVLVGWLGFILGSLVLIGSGRAPWGRDYMLEDRYQVYGLLLLVILLAFFARSPFAHRTPLRAAVIGVALLFCALSWGTLWPKVLLEVRLAASTVHSRAFDVFFPLAQATDRADSEREMRRAEKLGLFRLWSPAVLPLDRQRVEEWTRRAPILRDSGTAFGDEFRAVRLPADAVDGELALVLGGQPVVVPIAPVRAPWREVFASGELFAQHDILLPSGLPRTSSEPLTLVLLARRGENLQPVGAYPFHQ